MTHTTVVVGLATRRITPGILYLHGSEEAVGESYDEQRPAQDLDSWMESPDWILQLQDNHLSKSDLLPPK